MDHCILLLQHLPTHMHFITTGYKRFSKTNSTDPRQRVPLILPFFFFKLLKHKGSCLGKFLKIWNYLEKSTTSQKPYGLAGLGRGRDGCVRWGRDGCVREFSSPFLKLQIVVH